jgi:hypothetical protein
MASDRLAAKAAPDERGARPKAEGEGPGDRGPRPFETHGDSTEPIGLSKRSANTARRAQLRTTRHRMSGGGHNSAGFSVRQRAGGLKVLGTEPRAVREKPVAPGAGNKVVVEVMCAHATGGVHGRTPADPLQRARGKGRVKAPLRRARGAGAKPEGRVRCPRDPGPQMAMGRIEHTLLDEGRASSPTDLRPSPATPPYHKKCQMFLSTTKGRSPVQLE